MAAGLDTPLRGYSTSMRRRGRVLSLTIETRCALLDRQEAQGREG
jgi:hypothetical protein